MLVRARAWLGNLGLQRRIQLLTAVGLSVIFAFFWWAGQQAVETSTRQSLDNQVAVASAVASSLDYRLNAALSLLAATATELDLSRRAPADLQAATLQKAQSQLSAYGRRLFWLDPDGNVLWVEPFDAGLVARPFPDFPAVRPALEENARYISNLIQSPAATSSQPFILLAVSVSRPAGGIDSLLVEEVDADQLGLGDLLSRVAVKNGYIQVVDHAGTVLASSLSWSRFYKGDHTNQFARMIDSQQSMVGECHQCHTGNSKPATSAQSGDSSRTEEILAFAPLSVAPWGVAVREPAGDVLAPANTLRMQLLLGGGVALAATWLITWLITRQIVEPIKAMGEASAQFAAGRLDVPVPSGGIDEVARLTANLEQMRVRLEATLADHRRWNEALEEMVEERTRELTSLYEQFQGKEVMCKRLLGQVLTAQEEERTRLARELHDTIGQALTAIIMTTTVVENSLPAALVSGRDKLATVRHIAAQTLQDLRNLIFDLRPEILDDLGLALAIRSQVKKCLEPAGVKVHLKAAGLKDQLPAEVETAVFRVVQEAITNIARHAQATEANISLIHKDGKLIVRVEDDGVGFDPALVMNNGQTGWGLRGMEERITLLGGKFYIGSKAGNGTLLLAEVPLEQTGLPALPNLDKLEPSEHKTSEAPSSQRHK
jgi:signal transduction histidine kinase